LFNEPLALRRLCTQSIPQAYISLMLNATTHSQIGNSEAASIYSLVELMGGTIVVQSVVGQGSQFIVILPLIPADRAHSLGVGKE
jgi:hypothetical protein